MMSVERYLEYHGGCSVPWEDIIFCYLSTVGDIMSTLGVLSTMEALK